MKNGIQFLLAALLLIILLQGCSVTRHFESNEFLLVKNHVQVSGGKIAVDELVPYIGQQPNSRFGFLRINIALYNWGSRGDDSKFKTWLRTKAGAAPVLLDTSLTSQSIKQMRLYLYNKGYFNSIVSDSVFLRKKKAVVHYYAHLAPPYLIRNINYAIADTQIARFVYRDTVRSAIKRGNPYDAYVLDEERTRITNNLMNNGFYRFSANYIKYTIDTNLRSHQLDMVIEIVNDVAPSFEDLNNLVLIPHKRYFINKIYIYPDFDHINPFQGIYDTVVRTYQGTYRGQTPSAFYFLNRGEFPVKPRTLAQSVFITPQSYYNFNDVNQTYTQLAGLQVFKYINLQFRDVPGARHSRSSGKDVLDCHIELTPKAFHAFSITTDGTNSSGALGVQASVGYQNFNIFKGAQLFRINLNGSLQMQASDGFEGNKFFNTIELGGTASLTFPQFLLPVKPEKIHKNFKPKTIINIGYNYQLQQHYNRHISNITFGYTWKQKDYMIHTMNPIEVSLVKIFSDAYFDSVLASQKDNRLKNQYTDHLVAGLKYTFTFNNQKINKLADFIYLRTNIETGGNLFYAVNELLAKSTGNSPPYKMFGLPFAQFIRPDADIRYYTLFPNNYSVVYRFYGGIGIPYGNVNVLPFEKAFFAGGANGMRGWRMYALGPGTYTNTDQNAAFNQIGDIQLEANIEYRFPLYDWIRGAFYIDMGNIWLLKPSPDLPGGQFLFPDFFSQIAADMGVGLRFDFDFFIFRFDPAIPVRVPAYPLAERWRFTKLQLKDIVWNFGIGYPF